MSVQALGSLHFNTSIQSNSVTNNTDTIKPAQDLFVNDKQENISDITSAFDKSFENCKNIKPRKIKKLQRKLKKAECELANLKNDLKDGNVCNYANVNMKKPIIISSVFGTVCSVGLGVLAASIEPELIIPAVLCGVVAGGLSYLGVALDTLSAIDRECKNTDSETYKNAEANLKDLIAQKENEIFQLKRELV